jgi:ATP-dependent RNA helicase DeaD
MISPDSPAGFDGLALAPAVLRAIAELGYEAPTPVQEQCIPHLLAGRDLLGQAQTGTGKTAAFALPLLSRLELSRVEPQVLVLTPTRELALQVAEAFQRYAHHLPGFHVLPLYGGQSYGLQVRQLRHGAQVIVGTPGRVMDHLRRATLSLASIRSLVLDEADEMLAMGFADDIEWIFGQAPEQRQVVLFSATMPRVIRRVAQAHLSDPVTVRISAQSQTVETIAQHHCLVTRHHKLDLLTRILETDPFDAMLVFVRTKTATAELKDRLLAHGFAAEALNGDMSQEAREDAVARLRRGGLDLLVATDVAARGLDVERISHVINFDIPTDASAYVHRIGRTGRAGRPGRALLFVEPRERHLLRAIERTVHQRIPPLVPPSAEEVSESRIGRLTAQLREALATEELDFFYRLVARMTREQELEVMDIAAALAFLGQRGRPLEVREHGVGKARRAPEAREPGAGPGLPGKRDSRGGEGAGSPPGSGGGGRSPGRDRRLPAERDATARADAGPGATARSGSSREDRRPKPGHKEAGRTARAERHRGRRGEIDMVRYRIEVGRSDGVTPREIVGAIANEAGLEGRYIGRIEILDAHSVLDLPDGMPKEILRHLQRVFVCGKPLRLRPLSPRPPEGRPHPRGRGRQGPGLRGQGRDRARSSGPPGKRPRRPKGNE